MALFLHHFFIADRQTKIYILPLHVSTSSTGQYQQTDKNFPSHFLHSILWLVRRL